MQKLLLFILIITIFLFVGCQKRRCKEKQTKDMQALVIELQHELSASNLTMAQIIVIKARYDAKQKQILAECD
jgi:uncharacterized protein YcfL